jgi:hypothetical protein
LIDEPGTGRVRLAKEVFGGRVPRDDVAAVLDAILHEPHSAGLTLYVNSGPDPIEPALASLLAR